MTKSPKTALSSLPTMRRLGVAEAKAHLSELLRGVEGSPMVIHNRGRDLAVVVAIDEFERLEARAGTSEVAGAGFLARVEILKSRFSEVDTEFEPERIGIRFEDPFAESR